MVITIFVALGAWLWSNNLRARELAHSVSAQACRSIGAQFLDDTVSINRLGIARNASGRMQLQRIYGFEFTLEGDLRREGRVAMQGTSIRAVHLDHPDGAIILEPNQLN